MIQEKDFLYRVPVKNALVTAPGQQVRNPEILVDVEGGEFMRGNILDANSTNKLINQSVKDAINNNTDGKKYIPYTTTDNENIGDTYVIDGKDGITNLSGNRAISFDSGRLLAYDFNGNNKTIGQITIDPHFGGDYSNAIEVVADNYTPFAVNWVDGLIITGEDGSSTSYTSMGVNIDGASGDSILSSSMGYFTIGAGLKINENASSNNINKGNISVDPKYITNITLVYDKKIAALEATIKGLEARIAALEAKHPETSA